MSNASITARSLFFRWGDLRIERVILGMAIAICFLCLSYFVFGHRCSAGSEVFEHWIPWVVAVLAYLIVTRLRVWAALVCVVLLSAILYYGAGWYIYVIHHGSPSECLKHSA